VLPRFEGVLENVEPEEIVERLIRYFLPFFIEGNVPRVIISVDGAEFIANDEFQQFFSTREPEVLEVELDGEIRKLNLQLSKVKKGKVYNNHALLIFSDNRAIGPGRNIERKIGASSFKGDNDENQVYLCAVSGDYLNGSANFSRTQSSVSSEEVDEIVKKVASRVLEIEDQFVQKHREDQAQSVENVIRTNPLLRTAIPEGGISEYVSKQQMSWKEDQFVSDLALKRWRKRRDWEKFVDDGVKSAEELKENREKILNTITQENKNSLAAYVVHRKAVIDLFEKTLGFQDDGEMAPEDMLHDIVFSRYEDSDSREFFAHNLWLLDEKLAFFSYISSDRTIKGKARSKGEKIADLLFYDDCTIYRQSDGDVVVLVEFKKPGRDDYRYGNAKQDPVQQVKDTGLYIRQNGSYKTTSGRTIEVPDGVRIFAYVVADMVPSLRTVCGDHDMKTSWDGLGYFKYHETRDIFIEVVSYDKVLKDVKDRNASFLKVLLGDLID